MSLLEQDTIKKGQVNEKTLLEPGREFEGRNNKEYEVETIIDSAVYGKEAANDQMPGLYYLIL